MEAAFSQGPQQPLSACHQGLKSELKLALELTQVAQAHSGMVKRAPCRCVTRLPPAITPALTCPTGHCAGGDMTSLVVKEKWAEIAQKGLFQATGTWLRPRQCSSSATANGALVPALRAVTSARMPMPLRWLLAACCRRCSAKIAGFEGAVGQRLAALALRAAGGLQPLRLVHALGFVQKQHGIAVARQCALHGSGVARACTDSVNTRAAGSARCRLRARLAHWPTKQVRAQAAGSETDHAPV